MKCGIVILNYKDFATTISLLERIKDSPEIDCIVVVDNNSPNDSYSQLKKYESAKIAVIQSGRNGGYSFGNNVGIRYLIDNFNPDIIGIANPDVIFDDRLTRKIKELFELHSDYAVITGTGLYRNQRGEYEYSNLWGPDEGKASVMFKKALFAVSVNPILRLIRKLFHIRGKTNSYVERIRNTPGVFHEVWAVCGCLFFIRTEDFVKIGMFDENIFLYCEEFILAAKLQKLGRKTGITTEAEFIHEHVHSADPINRLEAGFRDKMRTRDSEIYYFGHYLTESTILRLAYTVLKKIEKLKSYVVFKIRKMILKRMN